MTTNKQPPQKVVKSKSAFTFIDLFSGLGGFHLALNNHATCVFAAEWDPAARKTYALNFGPEMLENGAPFASDITKVDPKTVPDHTVLCGGFPCQPFSIAGKQKGFGHPTQGTLFFDIVKIVQEKRPRVLFLENVRNLASHDGGNTFQTILKSLEDEGYHTKHEILNGTTHGNIPQNRERIFIVSFRDKEDYDHFSFPDKIPLTVKTSDIIELNKKQDADLYQTNMDSPSVQKMVEGIKNKGSIYQYRRFYLRENKNGICPTLTANMGGGGHNVPLVMDDFGIRKLSPRECLSFQGFPMSYKLPAIGSSHLYKQAGNSVIVPVVTRIADKIFEALHLVDKNKNKNSNNKSNKLSKKEKSK